MKISDARAGLERAGYSVSLPNDRGLYDVTGLGTDLTEAELVALAHRHGSWRPAFEGAHRTGGKPLP